MASSKREELGLFVVARFRPGPYIKCGASASSAGSTHMLAFTMSGDSEICLKGPGVGSDLYILCLSGDSGSSGGTRRRGGGWRGRRGVGASLGVQKAASHSCRASVKEVRSNDTTSSALGAYSLRSLVVSMMWLRGELA